MAKTRGALFSVEAYGTLDGTITYQRGRTGVRVMRHKSPKQPRTDTQLAQRAQFTSAVNAWRALPGASQAWWNAKAQGMATCGYNLYIKNYLLGLL